MSAINASMEYSVNEHQKRLLKESSLHYRMTCLKSIKILFLPQSCFRDQKLQIC